MISPSPRPLPDNTQHSQQTNIHAPGGIRTHNRSRRAAEDLRLRPRGHWDRPKRQFVNKNLNSIPLSYTQPLPEIEAKIRRFSFLSFHYTVQLARLDHVRNGENSQIRWQQDDIPAWRNTLMVELIALQTSPMSHTYTFQREHTQLMKQYLLTCWGDIYWSGSDTNCCSQPKH